MVWFWVAGLLLGIATLIDLVMKVRMTRIGYKWALFWGGAFDYGKYVKESRKHGWSFWPVPLFLFCVILGIAMLGYALFRPNGFR